MRNDENIFHHYLLNKIFSSLILSLLFIAKKNINSYLIFPIEYLHDNYYKFINKNSNNNTPQEIMQQIYFKILITKLPIGNPTIYYTLLLETNSERFYLSSIYQSTKNKEPIKFTNFYNFTEKDCYNELMSSTYIKNKSKIVSHGAYQYSELCEGKEKIIFYKNNNKIIYHDFPIKIARTHDDYIPGYIGLIYNDSYYEFSKSFFTELKSTKLIDNYYWFFNIEKISPLEKIIKSHLIIGGLPHEIFPNKFSLNDFIYTNSHQISFNSKAWRIKIDKIYVYNKTNNYQFKNNILTLSYDIYNVLGNMEFHSRIRNEFMDKLIEEKKCFKGNFSENKFSNFNMTFYYCNKSIKNILYENLPYIKFSSLDFGFTFELTKEEIFYIKDNYIYLMILFCNHEYNYWVMGQMFMNKYNFVFNTDKRQIGLYKRIKNQYNNENKSKNINNNILIIFLLIIIAIFFTGFGLNIGRKIFGRKKIIVNELLDEKNYENFADDKIEKINDKNYLIEMQQKKLFHN